MSVSVQIDLRTKFGPARDQKRRPTCIAFAASDAHAAQRMNPFQPLSVEYAFYHASLKRTAFDPHSGVGMSDILAAVENDGQPEENGWPYLDQLPADITHYKPPADVGPVYRRGSQYHAGLAAGCHVAGNRADETLMVYPQLMRRAIDNVLRNAIRYSPTGSEILLNCTVDRVRQLVSVEVLDSGPGVPESMLTDIFQPFFRTAPGRESESGGAGLGLAIATEAIRMHDGTIAAQNRKEGGLQVTIVLPLRTPTAEPQIRQETE